MSGAPDVAGVIALALLALLGILPYVGHMRAVMRAPTRKEIQEAAELKLAQQILAFDNVQGYAADVLARVYADRILPDRRRART